MRELLTTHLDIIRLVPQIYDPEDNRLLVASDRIDQFIEDASSVVLGELKAQYGSTLKVTPYASRPRKGRVPINETYARLLHRKGNIKLIVKPDAITQAIVIIFKSESTFRALSREWGPLADGATNSIYDSDHFTIPIELWYSTAAAAFSDRDIILFSIYEYHPLVVQLATYAATIDLLNSEYTEQVPDASSAAQEYRTRYNILMTSIKNETTFIGEGPVARNIDPEHIPYDIDHFGIDVTDYPV